MTPLPPGFLDRPFAHRALHNTHRPENGLQAVRAAVAAGYGIEIDLQLSADDVAMVFHDRMLDRMTEATGPVTARSAKDLGRVALRASDGAICDGETIPTLPDVLEAVAGRVPLLIEIKDQDGALGPDVGRLERATAQALGSYEGPAALMSFNPYSVAMMAELAPYRPRGLTSSAFSLEEWPDVSEPRRAAHRSLRLMGDVGASFISHDADDLKSAAVARAKAEGLPVACWTVRSPAAQQKALEIADCVTFEGYLP